MGAAEKNRLHAARSAQALPAVIRQDLERSIAFHQRALMRLTRRAMKLIACDLSLSERYAQLDSVPAIAGLEPLGKLKPEVSHTTCCGLL